MRLPLAIPLRPSRFLAFALVCAHSLAFLAVAATDLAFAVRLALMALLALSLVYSLKRPAVKTLILQTDGGITLIYRDGHECKYAVAPSTAVFPWLIVLRVQVSGGIESLVLPTDAVGEDCHRQLRVWLRWKTNVAAPV